MAEGAACVQAHAVMAKAVAMNKAHLANPYPLQAKAVDVGRNNFAPKLGTWQPPPEYKPWPGDTLARAPSSPPGSRSSVTPAK
jgi:hypothetical protein